MLSGGSSCRSISSNSLREVLDKLGRIDRPSRVTSEESTVIPPEMNLNSFHNEVHAANFKAIGQGFILLGIF